MRITYKGDYALKSMLDLAINYGTKTVSSHDMADRIDAPIKFLEQVLLELKKGGFVDSRRGNVGGYMLSRPPDKITLGEVVRYIDGPIEPIACVKERYANCVDTRNCVFRRVWADVARATSGIVDNITFGDLVADVRKTDDSITYTI